MQLYKPIFDAFFISGEMGVQKPEPAVFERIMSAYSLSAPDEILHIGDRYENLRSIYWRHFSNLGGDQCIFLVGIGTSYDKINTKTYRIPTKHFRMKKS